MDFTMLPLSVQLPAEPFAFSLDELAETLATIEDKRKPRGVRYPLYPLLIIALLAKLTGHSKMRDVAHWAKLREKLLCPLLGLPRNVLPHHTTWSRIFGFGLDPAQLDRLSAEFFSQRLCNKAPKRGSIVLNIDGKTLRGTIPAGSKKGVHLVAAYLPGSAIVLAQLEVSGKANELSVTPTLLGQLDLHGMVVTGDAMFAQRNLSAQVVEGGGDYLWTVKGNQESLRDEIAWLFMPLRAGEREEEFGWRRARQVYKGHGRIEEREIVVSDHLQGYSDWPYLQQVFKVQVIRTESDGKVTQSERYGVTSLPASVASPRRLLAIVREHWGIEGGLHQRRDVTLEEDRSQVRMGKAPHVLASLNNIVISLVVGCGEHNLADAQREFDFRFGEALHSQANQRFGHAS